MDGQKPQKQQERRILILIEEKHMKTIINHSENLSKSIETCLILRIQVTLTTQHIQIRLKFRKCLQFGKFDPYFRSALHIFSKLY